MNEVLISIIVPVYNVEHYLKKCVDSICCQTYKNLEIILVDDGSTDCSGSLCDEFLVVVYKDNKTGKKDKVIIKDPEYTYYVAKPNVNLDYNRLFIERNKVDEVTVPFKQLEKSIAEHSGNEEFYKANIRDRSERRKLHTARNIFL